MLIQIFLALMLGILFGTLTGLIPGIHINLIGAILITSSITFLSLISPTTILIFIIAMAITHTFVDFIPSIFLGAPDEDTILSILPGHQLLKQGRGYEAIIYTIYGSLIATFIILLISPIFIFIVPKFENIITNSIPFLLIISTIFLISKENYKLTAIIVFTLSGFLGIAVLNSNINQPFLPMLSGLFGASSLIISISQKTKIPKQKIYSPKIFKSDFVEPILASIIASPLCCFLPGLGSGQASVIGISLIKPTKRNFLILLGATNTLVLGLSFIVFYTISKTRTGMAVLTENIFQTLTTNQLYVILITIILTGILCFYWTILIARIFTKNIHKINYSILSIITLTIISSIVFFFSGFLGFFIFLVSTTTGLYGILSGVKRINLMGCIVIPVVLFYLF